MSTMQYWNLEPPAQWQAGAIGEARTPFYFSCADCGAKKPKIAGILSTDGTYSGIGLLGTFDACNLRPAMFCKACFTARLNRHTDTLRVEVHHTDDLTGDPT